MKIGIVGLGRMGANMAERLMRGGHRVVGSDLDSQAVAKLAAAGGEGAADLADLASRLPPPRAVWLMVPAGKAVDQTLDALLPHLAAGDVVVDGGNSFYRDSIARAERLTAAGVGFVDAGTSGGVWGLEEGYSLMVGGEDAAVAALRPIFETLAPAPDRGWGHVGPVGAGHFVKMVHNGVEYALMEAYAEGLDLLRGKEEFGLDLHQVAEIWRYGSVVRSWLLDLAARALERDPQLADLAPYVADSGEGRWTVAAALELGVAAPAIAGALMERFRSQDDRRFGDRLLAALRREFGGHPVRQAAAGEER